MCASLVEIEVYKLNKNNTISRSRWGKVVFIETHYRCGMSKVGSVQLCQQLLCAYWKSLVRLCNCPFTMC